MGRIFGHTRGYRRLHPVTQLPLHLKDMQRCYQVARDHVSFGTRSKWESVLLQFIHVLGMDHVLRISTVSPLYTFVCTQLMTTSHGDRRICKITYQLNSGTLSMGQVRTIYLQVPKHKRIQIYHVRV